MSSSESGDSVGRCSNCGEQIDGQPLHPARDVKPGEDGLVFVADPDGPFCDVDCRREFDSENDSKEEENVL